MPRIISPSGGSILTTSAPRSPRICVATGPRTAIVMSMTRLPANGPDMPTSKDSAKFFWPFCYSRPGESGDPPGRLRVVAEVDPGFRRDDGLVLPLGSKPGKSGGDRVIAPLDADDLALVRKW